MNTALKENLLNEGFVVLKDIFSTAETLALITLIGDSLRHNELFRRAKDVFAIRCFLQQIPQAASYVFNGKIRSIISETFGRNYFLVKSIYFDKPGSSNWFVSYHQDLTISVDRKAELPGYGPWTVKPGQFAVQPPIVLLERIFTIRIHLDDTDEHNGALRIIPGSHRKSICRPQTLNRSLEKELSCPVPAGGIMIMKPLLLHASGRTVNEARRRVIHLEFCDQPLPEPLRWAEKTLLSTAEH